MNLKQNRFPSTASMLLVILALIALVAAWQSPLLGTPTLEAALFLGLFLAPASFMAGICRGALRNHAGVADDVRREGIWVFCVVSIYLFVIYLHSLNLQSCSPSAGLLPFLMMLLPQLFLNLVTGVWIGRLIGHLRLAVVMGLFLLIAYLGIQFLCWWSNPSMRFFDLYWFLVAGDLFKGQSLNSALIAYRISAFLYACALFILGTHWKKHATKFWMVFFLFGSAVLIHWQSSAQIAPSLADRKKDYPDLLVKGPVNLHTNLKSVGQEHAEAILQESALWLVRLQERTGVEAREPIHIWLYDSLDSLSKHVGAHHVHFTLPAHREIHITSAEVPHPTLGHELAHVVIGQLSDTLWRIPGIWGVLPNWGLSEGLATYLTPELSSLDDLTTREQAAALYRLGFEKQPEDLLEADLWSFWIQSSLRAYAASASLLDAYIEAQCRTSVCRAKSVRRLALSGQVPLRDSFIKSYHTRLEDIALPPDALPSVSARFAEKSVLLATCSSIQSAPVAVRSETANILELPIPKQRERLIKNAFETSTAPYAKAGLELIAAKPVGIMEIGARYGKLGFSLAKSAEESQTYAYAAYLLARAEILSGDFGAGLSLMPVNLEGLMGQESKRLMALAQSQTGLPQQAAVEFDRLKAAAVRPADAISFGDFAERARGIAMGDRFLLGVWPKP